MESTMVTPRGMFEQMLRQMEVLNEGIEPRKHIYFDHNEVWE